MALGALTILIAKKLIKNKNGVEQNAALISSGLLGGEGITGVLIAIFSMITM